MRSRFVSAALVITALLSASRSAGAQGYFEVGGFDSYTRFDRSLPWPDVNSGGARLSFGSGEGVGAFVLEGEGAYFSLGSGPTATRFIPARARLLYTPTFGKVSLLMGGGGVRNDFSSTAPGSPHVAEWGYTSLVGLRLAMGSYMALRLEGVLDYVTHPANATATMKRNTNRSLQAGLSFPLWSDRPAPREKPAAATPAPVVAPAAAPVASAPAALAFVAPAVSRESLLDADRDGVPDTRDTCSNTAAGSTVDASGCAVFRDSDSDGVIDQRDSCAATAAGEMVDGRGCAVAQDSDEDGVPNVRDRCANTSEGTPVNSVGCPLAVAPAPAAAPAPVYAAVAPTPAPAPAAPAPLFKGPERTVTLRGVNFAPLKDELAPGSMAVLDDVARQLVDAPNVKRIEIAGHTDARGSYMRNLRLSLARAEAVRAYLIMRGVEGDRLVARGYGMTKPISENTTVAGRAMNRRVELRRLD